MARINAHLEIRRKTKQIIEHKILQARLDKARITAEIENRTKSAFLANMSHEIRTPLNSIIGYSDLIAEDAKDLEHCPYLDDLDKIRNAGRHLLALINDVLDLAKIQAGKLELCYESVDIEFIARQVIDLLQPIANSGDNEIHLNFDDWHQTLISDELRLTQIIFNLLSNACKFTKNGKIVLNIASTSDADGNWLVMAVTDDGEGMTEEEQTKLFMEFSQTSATIARNHGGTGLGLAICQQLSVMMAGDIRVDSKKGVGTTFTVRLPLAPQ